MFELVSNIKPQLLVIVVGILLVGACAALAAGSIMTTMLLGELETHCKTANDCSPDDVAQIPYVKKWNYMYSGGFLVIGVAAAIAVVAAGVMIYYKSRAAPLAAAGAAEALKGL